MILSDTAAEKAVLAGMCRYGIEAYYDVADILNEQSFTSESNSVIYACIKKTFAEHELKSLDLPSILSSANELGVAGLFNDKRELGHLQSLFSFPVNLSNVRKFAAKIRKLQIARMMYEQLGKTQDKYLKINGDESISHILGIAEESIFNFSSLLNDTDDSPKKIFDNLEERLEELASDPVDQIGIPTGFKMYDFAIGGGLRKGTVNVIAARPKTGKTLMAMNIGYNVAKLNIPVLNLDTEMTTEDQQYRGAAMVAFENNLRINIQDIETGKFGKNDFIKSKLKKAAAEVASLPYYHKTIGGTPFEDQLSIMRRWIAKEVGLNDDGTAKDCLIIYDYLKLMDSKDLKGDLKEYQMLGFMMTSLHNFSLRYKIPILLFIQLNRDGITKESTDTASGSDRIIWLCSNFTIYKQKSDEEIASDGPEHGNRKLVPIVARHGEGLQPGDYINIHMYGKHAKLIEGKTSFQINNVEQKDEEDVKF